MTVSRLLLRPAARLGGWHAGRQLRQFLAAHQNSRAVQDALLERLVAMHADTRFGRDHGLARVRGYDDFRRAVPVGDYEAHRPYMDAAYAGDAGALFPAGVAIHLFALTSGTTGQPKRIPVTPESLVHYRRGWNVFGLRFLGDHPAAWLRPILQLTGPAIESYSPAGVPCGSISGLLADTQKRIVRRMYVVPPAVRDLADPVTRLYTTLRLAMPRDVSFITTANPSTIVQLMTLATAHAEPLLRDLRDGTLTPPGELPGPLRQALGPRLKKHPALVARIEAGLARDGELRTGHFWDLAGLMHWTGGTLGLYLPQVQRLTGGVPSRDIGLLASEGRLSVPLDDHTPAGVAEVLGAFLEFIPAEAIGQPDPPTLRSHELTVGEEYFVVLTNFSGLWRYNIHDRIRVTGQLGQSPVFAFLSKGSHTANLTGEKLTEHQAVQAVRQALQASGVQAGRFLAQPCFADEPYYCFTLESPAPLPAGLAGGIDSALQALNIEYASKRSSGRLGPVRLSAAAPADFDRREARLLADRPARATQYKHQYLLTDVCTDEAPAAAALFG